MLQDATKPLMALSLVLLLLLPIVAVIARKKSYVLMIFYLVLALGIAADFSGSGSVMPLPGLLFMIVVFGVAAAAEYASQRSFWMAIFSSLTLLLFACALYLATVGGAFAQNNPKARPVCLPRVDQRFDSNVSHRRPALHCTGAG